MGVLARYKNGNLITTLYSDGTRVRETQEDEFRPAFAENVDVYISDRCDNNCPMCYANCTSDGAFGDLFNWEFLNLLHPGTEMALNLNFPLHPEIEKFLYFLKEKKIIVNATVNQRHFEQNEDLIKRFLDEKLIWGLGVSLYAATPEFVERIKRYPNAVIHVINGLFSLEDLSVLGGNCLKLLILGYKDIGRGVQYHKDNSLVEKRKTWLYNCLGQIIGLGHFDVISFDNLALEQLDVKRFLTDKEWEEFYGGDDGTFTFFINLPKGYFAKNSLSEIQYPINDLTMDQMFDVIRKAG